MLYATFKTQERGHDLINDQPIDLTELQMPPLSAYIVAIR